MKKQDNNAFWAVVVFASITAAFLVQIFNQDPINLDGILYLEVAQFYLKYGLHAAMALYPWPFYAVLLGIFSHWLHLDMLTWAFWLNNILITLMVVFWLAILKELTDSRVVLWWGAALILLYPSLNHLRMFVFRDAGYWAFLFAGLWCLYQYLKYPRVEYALLFSFLLFMATLFRIEGAVVWGAAPLVFLSFKHLSLRQKIKYLIETEIFLVLLVMILCVWKISSHQHHFSQLGRVSDFWTIFKQHSSFSLSAFFMDLIKTLTPLYGFLVIYGAIKHRLPAPSPQRALLIWLLCIQFCIPLIFYTQIGIVTERYLVPFCLTLSLLSPFILPSLSRQLRVVVLVIFTVMACSGIIPFGYSKAYLIEAGKWLKQHVSPADRVFSNSREVLFYAGISTIDWQNIDSQARMLLPLQDNSWKTYNYLAIRLNKNDDKKLQQLTNRLSLQPIKIFRNNRDDKVEIFYVPH